MTFAYPLPIGYQNLINSLKKHMRKDVVSGLSRRKQGFDSPWGYQLTVLWCLIQSNLIH